MLLRKKTLVEEAVSSAFVLPELMSAMDSPQIELSVETLTPAPSDWNFFRSLPDGKFLELCDSIAQHGLIHPLLVWEQDDGVRMILSGHNRVRALLALLESTGDTKYQTAPCVIRRGLTNDEARSLLTDANWVQRTLTPSEKARCVARRYASHGRLISGEGGRAYDRVAQHFGLKATQVYNYIKIATLPPDILEFLDAGLLSMRAATLVAKLPMPELDALRQRLNGDFSTDRILNELNPKTYETLTFQVPSERANEIRRAVTEILQKL